jgi:hypothetical protein
MLGRSLLMKASGSLLLYPAYVQDYLDRVTAKDVQGGNSQGLERGVTDAFSTVLQDLVADTSLGISGGVIAQAASKIKAMPFMCGARTLLGCLVPVVGPAPTNFNFTEPRYNRKTGLLGNAASMYLDSNRNNTAEPQNDKSLAIYTTQAGSGQRVLLGGNAGTWLARDDIAIYARLNVSTSIAISTANSVIGFMGASRSSATAMSVRFNGASSSWSSTSDSLHSTPLNLFRRPDGTQYANDRISFYSIGESLDLAILDARISTLMATLAAVIP